MIRNREKLGGSFDSNQSISISDRASLAQLDRVPGFEPVGRRFESCRARFSSIAKIFGPPIQESLEESLQNYISLMIAFN